MTKKTAKTVCCTAECSGTNCQPPKLLTPARYRARAEIVKALAHPTRLMMVDKLAAGECCVCELRDLAGVDISTVSRHLALLQKAGIIASDKRGLYVYYRLCCPCIGDFFGCIERILQKRASDTNGSL
jgi:ArsR family transcriptional regulator